MKSTDKTVTCLFYNSLVILLLEQINSDFSSQRKMENFTIKENMILNELKI